MVDEPSVPPGSVPFQNIGAKVLDNIENRLERVRGMVTSFYRQFDDLDNDIRVQKAKIVSAELAALVGTFRGLARRRGELDAFEYQTKAAWDQFRRKGTFTAYNAYVQKILEICVDMLDWWKFLFNIQSPGEDVIDYIYQRSINSAKEVIIKEMIRQGRIGSRRDIQFIGVREDIPESVSVKVKEAMSDANG